MSRPLCLCLSQEHPRIILKADVHELSVIFPVATSSNHSHKACNADFS